MLGHVDGAHDQRRRYSGASARVDSEDDVGVEHSDERGEVARAGRGQERVDDAALGRKIGVRRRRSPVISTAPARSNPLT
jgi:hypothetical protein